jgi:hypothetical protein
MVHITADYEVKIRARITELKKRLQGLRDGAGDFIAIHRLEGNIGALEWVLREAGCKP